MAVFYTYSTSALPPVMPLSQQADAMTTTVTTTRSEYWLNVLSSDWLRPEGLVWKTGNPNLSGCFVERRGWAGGWPQTVSLSLSLGLYLFNS